ncbi:PREDICTED: protein NUCLEAR FUSION DEFECTIVE 2 [Tarenaya hassleriana]|uniref:protein NUCLEAR FUSION DEFECTIVE 2 n=1 Tax=Tarenaya hassleriana TaxID=28532 RepID=UPI00053C5528|nr:PREDICTED: protein NUCLEAR FUSION DEFECTIVE 2 [Tarenaya hassleriana]
MASHRFTLVALLFIEIFSSASQIYAGSAIRGRIELHFSPFASALETLQKQIGYNFSNTNLLRRAMTHASYSEENNKALSILGTHIIETSVSLHFLTKDIDVSSKELNRLISEVSNVNSSCALDGKRLGLQKIIRVSHKTDASNSVIICGAFRAIFGAIATDAEMVDDAIKVFWKVHGGQTGKVVSA